MGSTTIAVDLAKSIFEVAVSDHPGRIAENHRLSRDRMMRFFAEREADSGLPDLLRSVLAEALVDIRELEEHVHRIEIALKALAAQVLLVARLSTIPGVGPLTSTALVALEKAVTMRSLIVMAIGQS